MLGVKYLRRCTPEDKGHGCPRLRSAIPDVLTGLIEWYQMICMNAYSHSEILGTACSDTMDFVTELCLRDELQHDDSVVHACDSGFASFALEGFREMDELDLASLSPVSLSVASTSFGDELTGVSF